MRTAEFRQQSSVTSKMYRPCSSGALMCCLLLQFLLAGFEAKVVTEDMEREMRAALRDAIHTTVDSDGFRFLTGGILRACFHDCVVKCDGCVNLNRRTASANNGIEKTWDILTPMWESRFSDYCSRADFVALACVEVTDYTMERGVLAGTCEGSNDECRPPMRVSWGRHTCSNPRTVQPERRPPFADNEPYHWFATHMGMHARETICIMGAHSVGKLRRNETGFDGSYTTRDDVLDNEFFTMMVQPENHWVQKRRVMVIDNGAPQARFQWELQNTTTGRGMTRVNADMKLLWDLGGDQGKVSCDIPKSGEPANANHCKPRSQFMVNMVHEMANDNKNFLRCFVDAMDKVLMTGYQLGELVPTGMEIPGTESTAAPATTQSTSNTTATTAGTSDTTTRKTKKRKLTPQEKKEKKRVRQLKRRRNQQRIRIRRPAQQPPGLNRLRNTFRGSSLT